MKYQPPRKHSSEKLSDVAVIAVSGGLTFAAAVHQVPPPPPPEDHNPCGIPLSTDGLQCRERVLWLELFCFLHCCSWAKAGTSVLCTSPDTSERLRIQCLSFGGTSGGFKGQGFVTDRNHLPFLFGVLSKSLWPLSASGLPLLEKGRERVHPDTWGLRLLAHNLVLSRSSMVPVLKKLLETSWQSSD